MRMGWSQVPIVQRPPAMLRRLIQFAVAAATLILNPFFACSEQVSFSFGLPQIEAALAGTWEARWTHGDQRESVTFRVTAARAERSSARGLISAAAACSKRTLVRSAHACLDITKVPLDVSAVDDSRHAMTGDLRIVGTTFRDGDITFAIDDVTLRARISATGEVTQVDTPEHATNVELIHRP
jgi:hypothetical protein